MNDAIIEMVLQCAVACSGCTDNGIPDFEDTMEHGPRYFHVVRGMQQECKAALLWKTINRLRARGKA